MKGLMRRAAVLPGGTGALVGSLGCYGYRDLVDPCYPERYKYASRKELHEAFAPQVQNGHVLDQTVWNYMFEPGTDKLTAGGLDHLAYLARRRPEPDCTIYLQTAQDLAYDAAAPEKLVDTRRDLDALPRRGRAVLRAADRVAGRPGAGPGRTGPAAGGRGGRRGAGPAGLLDRRLEEPHQQPRRRHPPVRRRRRLRPHHPD